MALPDPKRTAAKNMIKRSGPDSTPFLKAILDVAGLIAGGPVAAGAAVAKAALPDKKESSEPEMLKETSKYDPTELTSFDLIEPLEPFGVTEREAIEPYDREIRPLKERKPKRRHKLTTGRLGGSEE